MSFEWFVARRYLRSPHRPAILRLITLFSVIGVAAGVATLVIALSMNSGFRETLQDRLLGVTAHISLTRPGSGGISPLASVSPLAAAPRPETAFRFREAALDETPPNGALPASGRNRSGNRWSPRVRSRNRPRRFFHPWPDNTVPRGACCRSGRSLFQPKVFSPGKSLKAGGLSVNFMTVRISRCPASLPAPCSLDASAPARAPRHWHHVDFRSGR